jgi:hypothetical protein
MGVPEDVPGEALFSYASLVAVYYFNSLFQAGLNMRGSQNSVAKFSLVDHRTA